MSQRIIKWSLRCAAVLLFATWACAPGSGAGCSSCTGQGFSYPSTTAGKEPIANAAVVRINQAALDWVETHLPDIFTTMCCPTDSSSSIPANQQCWGKSACFIDTIAGTTTQRINFYLGSPGSPMKVGSNLQIRNGDPLPEIDTQYPGAAETGNNAATGNRADRPYCNDMGGAVCQQQNQNLARFCRPSSSPDCNNPNPTVPAERDYCCGDNAHGINWDFWNWDPTTKLDVCTGGRSPGRINGYPSSVSIRQADLQNLRLTVLPPSGSQPAGIEAALSSLTVGVDLEIAAEGVLGQKFTCGVQDQSPAQGFIQGASLAMEIRPQFTQPSPGAPEQVTLCPTCVTVSRFQLPTLGGLNVAQDSGDPYCQNEYWLGGAIWVASDIWCSLFCTVGNAGGDLITTVFNGVSGIASLIQGPLSSAIASAIAGQLNGLPVEVQTQLDAKALLSRYVPLQYGQKLGVLAAADAAGLGTSGTGTALGLSASIDIGTESDAGVCVPTLPAPAATPLPDANLPPTITVTDHSKTPAAPRADTYHLGAAIALPALQRAFYNVFNSGLLCVGVGSSDIARLTNGTQVISAGLLFLLAPELEQIADQSAPIFAQLEPQTYPTVQLGSGQATGQTNAQGQPTIDSLVQLSLQNLGLSFYIFADDRYTRVFTVRTDLAVGLSVLDGADNRLELSIDSIAISNVANSFNALSATDYSSIVKVIVNLLTGTVLSNQLTFSLNIDSALRAQFGPNAYVRINDIQRAGDTNDYLAAYLTFCQNGDATNQPVCANGGTPAADVVVPTLSDALPLYVAPPQPLPSSLRANLVPSGSLAVHVQDDGFPRQYAVRVDAGLYNSLVFANERGDIVVQSPELLILGAHRLDIRAQAAGHYETLSNEPQTLQVEIDPERPLASIKPTVNGLVLAASDLVSSPEQLAIEWRSTGAHGISDWHSGLQGETLTNEMLAGVYTIEARATDHAANVSDIAQYVWAEAPAAKAHGCNAGGASWWMMAVLIVLRRKSPV